MALKQGYSQVSSSNSGLDNPGANLDVNPGEEERDRLQIEAFVRGDMAGFKFVYNRHRQQVFSYCLYYTGEKVAAEDAFQEVFTRIYTHREQLREPKALKSWVLLITRSVCLNSLRTSKFTPEFVPIGGDSDAEGEQPTHKELTVDPREAQNSGDLLQLALSKLAPMYRDAFLLREFEGYSYEEIGEASGISIPNVKVRITRAKKQLRTILGPYFNKQQSGSGISVTSKVTSNKVALQDTRSDISNEKESERVEDEQVEIDQVEINQVETAQVVNEKMVLSTVGVKRIHSSSGEEEEF